ncbi:MAG: ASPIC/UnbV domain-containing protein, partial [Flavobacteriales bacterium]|nr:ASPIC/UnbV domain-containing protein [Flavobacteriales bacterium]
FQQEARIDLSNITDVSIADFNGDLLPDLFVSRGLMHETDIQLFNDSAVHASINLAMGIPPAMFGFRTQGPIEVRVSTEKYAPYSVHVGSDSGFVDPGERRIFTLYPDQAQGFQDPSAFPGGVQCSVGFLPDSTWRIELAHTGTGKESVLLEINSGFPITGLQSTGMPQPDSAVRDLLLLNQGGFQFSASTSPAFMQDEYSANVTSGDLDNDMDIDIFVVTTGRAKNRKTHLYENMGNGDFQFHENGWGTKGDVAGIGDAVTTTDYDNDGFLDLFVTNGSTNSFLDSAGVDLYRNLGNGNNWIKLDLKGVQSNADGFGARVIVQANGVEQVRDRTGGIHLVSQDDARLHVGLGTADSVDLITVYWPSGVVDVLHDQGVNAILTIVEGEHAQTDCLGVPGGTANVGTFCNDSDPCTTGDRYDANCNCTGLFADSDADGICDALDLCPAGPDEALLLNINLDPFGSQTTWKLFSSDGVVHAGGPYADGDTLVADTICVPAGCYKFKVFDSNGDGLSAGGYLLTDGRGEHIIDANGAFSALSFARTEFCLPLGAPHLIEEDCDQVLTDGDALTSSTVAGATQYRFLFFDPHGSYKRSFFRANGILGSGGMATLPKNLELNVRVSATGPGWSTGYGPTCTITIIESGDYGIQKLATSDAGAGAERIEIWPNPNKEGLVHLSVDGLADDVETAQITVRDALGHLIRTQVLPVVEGGLTTLMDLQGIGAGVYLVQVTSGPVVCHRRLVMTQ